MVTNGSLKIDGTFLKTQAIKETEFDAAGFPSSLKDAESFLRRPPAATSSSVPAPSINAYSGLKAGASSTGVGYQQTLGGFSERPQLNNIDGYYFSLGSDLEGSSLDDVRSDLLRPALKVNTIPGEFEKQGTTEYRKDPMFIYGQGLTPYSNQVNNLKTTSAIKEAWSNATVTPLYSNIASSVDGVSIAPATITADTIGTYTITPTSSGYYCFSFYSRLDGRNYYSLNTVRYLKLAISPNVQDYYIISEEDTPASSGLALFNLKFEWVRHAVVFYLTANTQYTISLNWFYRDTSISTTNNNFRASNLKIAGVLLEKKKWPSPYEVRSSNATGTKSIDNLIYHLAVFDLDSLGDNISRNKGWILSYKRRIFDNVNSLTPHYDSLGGGYWGYLGNQVVANNFNGGAAPSVDVSKFYLKWEHVILRHQEDSNVVNVYVTATNSNDSYSFNVNTGGIVPRGEFRGQEYNLMLGCRPDSIEEISNATYKDLIYVLDGSDSALQKVKNNLLGVFSGDMTIAVNDVKTTNTATIVTDMNIFEKANLEY